jgi:hypothetical protein
MHDSVISGHIGKKKTKEKLSHRYYWYEMREDISIWISQWMHTLSTSFGISDWSGCNMFSVKGTGMEIELNMS